MMKTEDMRFGKRIAKYEDRVARRKRFVWASIAAGVAWVFVASQFLR